MLKVHVRKGLLGEDGTVTQEFPFVSGVSPRQIAVALRDALPKSVPIDIAVNGYLLDNDYDQPLQDGDELVICPHTTGGIDLLALFVYAIISAIVGAGVSYAVAALQPKPKQPDTSFERGDSSSATYAWNGIKTNYGQGWTVPAVYGRHAVGGQVIESNTEADGDSDFSNDRVQVLLALSEGPIHAIGDLEVSVNDYLGSLSSIYTPPNPQSLPSEIYVNDQLLTNDALSGVNEYEVQFNGAWSPADPDINVGDTCYFYNTTAGQLASSITVRIARITGNSSNPAVRFDRPLPEQAIISAQQAGGTVAVQVGGFGSNQPSRNIKNPLTTTTITVIEQSAGALAFCRSGELEQPPMPTAGPGGVPIDVTWAGTSTAISVGTPLTAFGQTAEVSYDSGDDLLSALRVVLEFPGGLFTIDSNGDTQEFTVEHALRWRYQGDTDWTDFPNSNFFVSGLERNGFARTKTYMFPQNPVRVSGQIEVQVERLTGQGTNGTASQVRVRDLVFQSPYELTYPRVAQLGLVLQASARFNGGLPKVQARIDGIKVRVWDASNGFSQPTWNVPSAPFNWHTHPPGRNPAWILLDFLTQPWGLGEYLTDDDVDLPAIARWAVWCDRDPNPSDPWGEAQFCCDLVIDKPRPAWEWVLTICAAGGASPVFVNGKISVVYQYEDAHAQGSVSVPAKTATQLFTSGNVQDLQVQWLPRANRPTAFVYQFLNEEANYRQDVLTIEDADSTLNDPTELHGDKWRPEQQQAYGVTRPTQLFRDAIKRHRINRLVTRRIDFRTGRWALAATIGDLIEVETEVMRPFDNDVPTSAAVLVGGSSVSTITVDHTSLPSTGQIKYRDANGAPQVVNWTGTASTTVDLTSATELTLASAITVDAGAPCVVGTVNKLVETYEITAISLNEDLTRNVTALQWVPEVHDAIAPSAYADGTDFTGVITQSSATEPEHLPPSYTVGVERLPEGTQRISWQSPQLLAGVTKRVYQRADATQPWRLLGVTESDYLDTHELRPNVPVTISVVPESFSGNVRLADAATQATVTPTEFARKLTPQVLGVTVGDRSQLAWEPVTTHAAEEYEVREGRYWVGARTIYRGTQPSVTWEVPPLVDHCMVCVEDEDGSQGQPTTFAVTPWTPDGHQTFIDTDIVQDGLGTFDGVELVASQYIQLTSGTLSGTYTSGEQAPGFRASFLWRVGIEAQQLDATTVDEVRDRLGSGELNWRTVDGREASRHNIGVSFERDVDDATDKVDTYEGELAAGFVGAAGQHTRALVEGRFYDGSTWTAWEPWSDGYRNAERAQFRVVMDREAVRYDLLLHKLRITAHL